MGQESSEQPKYLLGIDLGSASLGWALIRLDDSGYPCGLLSERRNGRPVPGCGVRIFEPGVEGTDLDIEQGKDQSKAVARRTARLHRRQLRRRAYRQAKLFRSLLECGLLPRDTDGSALTPSQERNAILTRLDQELGHKSCLAATNGFAQIPLYRLRKAALDQKLEPYELGRVLYHLSQRRGFKSNRKEGGKADKEKEAGEVKAGIIELQRRIDDADARTLGEYFAGLDPHQIGQNIRRRWTARKMYEEEFAKIWERQAEYYPALLTPELRREVAHLLFFQRPIAVQSHLIGRCELEPDQRRAAWATLEAQRFRILQKVNDLKVIYPGDPLAQPLTAEERRFVFELLDREGDQKFAVLRKRLKLDPHSQFNLERGDEKRLRGNRTNAAMLDAFGGRWDSLSPETQKQVVEAWRTSESDEALFRRGIEHWGLDEVSAKKWVDARPEDGFCSLSRRAIGKLMSLMISGKSFKEAETEKYGARFSGGLVLDLLPPLHVHRNIRGSAELEQMLARLRLGTVRNPAVERALTELRKVVNAIVREYGKPWEIRIELARELKKPRKERQSLTKKNRKRQKEREDAKAALLKECGIQNPSRTDIEKALLHAECGGICPYSGRSIRLADLFGEHPQFDIEHIIPLSRYPDDSFQNKTLCWHEENRNIKRNKTPFEAYGAHTERWEAIEIRVRAWPVPNSGKLTRFLLRSEDDLADFTARQMNDTRYASVLAGRLLESLYGGRDVATPDGTRQVIFASSGAVTATLRRVWGLEAVLREAAPSFNGQSKGKPRTDHRHHAIDAITIALTKPAVIHSMSRSASADPNLLQDTRAFRRIESPWPNFVDSIRPRIETMLISHRPEHKISGALHDETNYSPPRRQNGKTVVSIRKPVTSLSAGDIESIVDDAVRRAVREKAERLGDLKKCESANDWPALRAKDGRLIPIKRVRMQKVLDVKRIASGERERFVAVANSHHTAIFALMEGDREVAWEGLPVSVYEAMERKRRGESVVRHEHPDGAAWKFKFSLMGGDTVELHKDCDHKSGKCAPGIYRVRAIETNGPLFMLKINDARLVKDIASGGDRWRPGANALRKLDCCKVVVDVLGRVHPAND
jgi:CRISPR-associated endonuclease Csn1